MKKLLAMVLALVMTLSLAVSANALKADEKINEDYAEAVAVLDGMGVFKGYEDGSFKPSGNVTGYEVLAMILRAVGYDKNGEFTGADWALHVAEIAERQGILDNVKGVDLNAPATRELVSELLFQSIQVPMVSYTAAFGYAAVVPRRAEVFAERGERGGLRVQSGRGRVGVRLERRVGFLRQVVEVLHLDEVLLLPLREGIVVGFFHVDPPIDKIGKANRLPYSFRL